MRISTIFTEKVGCVAPIMQGGLHHVGFASLASAISNAGGLGTITALSLDSPQALRDEIIKARSMLKSPDLPLAVNLTLLPMLMPPDYQAYADTIVEQKIRVVETAGRNPEKFVQFFKSKGIIVIHKCTSIRHALTAQRIGADFISMDGFEAGGHPGEEDVTNWVLIPKAAQVLSIPFIVSGSCCNGKQLAAALALGAQGMNLGTRAMATVEAPVHDGIKNALVAAKESDTQLVMRTMRNTERVFKNRCSQEVVAIEAKQPGEFPAIKHLVSGNNYKKSFQVTGDAQSSVWSCGQGIGLIDDIPTCADLIRKIVDEAAGIISNMQTKVSKL